MKPIIEVENLGKRYAVGARAETYATLRDALAGAARAPLNLFGRRAPKRDETFWALRDVSFEVMPGEVVGIVGRNGAGKSTLLKVLSRITEPTTGSVRLYGRMASLLEVGTGFHPELTGRENIFLNGAILGMRKAEIERKFDEIVAFAEIDKFLDTAVKRYSSGMYVRLAFAVAAYLQPEILVVDEVLAVGDAAFQKKCIGKMSDVAKSGRTVLFVSHNASAVLQLCTDCVWLDEGRVVGRGRPEQVVLDYLTSGQPESHAGEITGEMHEHEPLGLAFTHVAVVDEAGEPASSFLFGTPLRFRLKFEVTKPVADVRLGLVIHKYDDTVVCASHQTDDAAQGPLQLAPGSYVTELTVDLPLVPGSYNVSLFAKPEQGFWGSPHQSLDYVRRAASFAVEEVSPEGRPVLKTGAIVQPPSRWAVRPA